MPFTRRYTACKSPKGAYLSPSALLGPRHAASRTARCGATRVRIRTKDWYPPPCGHTARLPRTLLLAVGAEARARANIFFIAHGRPLCQQSWQMLFMVLRAENRLATSGAPELI